MFSPSSALEMISSIQYRASTIASGLFRSMGMRSRVESSSFSIPPAAAKLTSNTPANWLVIKRGAKSSMVKPMEAASINKLPCLWQYARSRWENWRWTLITLVFCGEALASRISRFTFADSGRLLAGFLDACIVTPPLRQDQAQAVRRDMPVAGTEEAEDHQ